MRFRFGGERKEGLSPATLGGRARPAPAVGTPVPLRNVRPIQSIVGERRESNGGPVQVSMTVNGRTHTAEVEPRLLLVHFLRETRSG